MPTRGEEADGTFAPPANSPSAFLAELRSFAALGSPHSAARSVASRLPLTFSGDVDRVLSGAHRVVTAQSEMTFACTGCGGCCRAYPNSVMLDPHDVFLISRAPSLAAGASATAATTGTPDQRSQPQLHPRPLTTTWLYRAFPKATQSKLGIFEAGTHLIDDNAVHSTNVADASASLSAVVPFPSRQLASRHKLAPVLFLRTKKVKQIARQTRTADQSASSAIEERCWFAVPGKKFPVDMKRDSAASATRGHGAVGLRCRLGPSHQPTSCALYPLGELYRPTPTLASQVQQDQPAAASTSVSLEYYTLDTTYCEGTRDVVPSASTRTTVGAYAERNGIPSRRREWDWFQREIAQPMAQFGWMRLDDDEREQSLASATASSRLASSFREELRSVLATIWYDFDSIDRVAGDSTLPPSIAEWPRVRALITDATRTVREATEKYVEVMRRSTTDQAEATALAQWRRTLRDAGVLKSSDRA